MIPLTDRHPRQPTPWVTFTLIGLLAVIYLWDRQWAVFGSRTVFTDLAARPIDIMGAFRGGDPWPLMTLVTSSFLHANLGHIVSNVLFLWVFGPRVEQRFGSGAFALLYIVFGIASALTQVFVDPASGIPMVGASGAIAGYMGCYLLLFPAQEIDAIVPPLYFLPFSLPAWVILGLWFTIQILFVQPGVANWAHAGGFLAGMLAAMVAGRRNGSREEALAR
jgi:membrane associated rhomboid family serine protease